MTLFSKMRLPTFGQGTYLSSVLAVGCFSIALLLASGARGAEGEGWRNLLPFGKKPAEAAPAPAEATTTEVASKSVTLGYPSTGYSQSFQPTAGNITDKSVAPAGTEGEASDSKWMLKSPFAKVTWPEIKMPKLEMRAPWKKDKASQTGEKNNWFVASVDKAKKTTQKAASRTRTAWNSSIDRMKVVLPGNRSEDTTTQVAGLPEHKPGFFERWFSKPATEEEDSEGVVEMMANGQVLP